MKDMYVKRFFTIMLATALFIGNLNISYAEETEPAETVDEETESAEESANEATTETQPETESSAETSETERVTTVKKVIVPVQRAMPQAVSVILPTVAEPSPFNFLMDPQELIYLTSAEKYGGGTVEEGATLLFRNTSGAYDFSSYSDKLTIKNESNVAVNIIVNASISDTSGINIVSSPDFGDSTGCDMYIALVDNKGQEIPLDDDGKIVANARLAASPESNYTYYLDQETGNYACVFNPVGGFDEYSFGLRGRCNPNGDWKDVNVTPDIVLTWSFEAEDAETITEDTEVEVTEEIEVQKETKEETEAEKTEDKKEEVKEEKEQSSEETQKPAESSESTETQEQPVENTGNEETQPENTNETTEPAAEPPVEEPQPENPGELEEPAQTDEN